MRILNLLASSSKPVTVGEVVDQVSVSQSTVSAHLKTLTEARFVLVEPRGTARFCRVNQACVSCFPTAADVVMGRGVLPFADVSCEAAG